MRVKDKRMIGSSMSITGCCDFSSDDSVVTSGVKELMLVENCSVLQK
jgi:hypothetical protein